VQSIEILGRSLVDYFTINGVGVVRSIAFDGEFPKEGGHRKTILITEWEEAMLVHYTANQMIEATLLLSHFLAEASRCECPLQAMLDAIAPVVFILEAAR
jgi:hypothetical protein